jgi:4-amino-4-deoxy-L-arabinose transferase-like glycosyltransferase
MTSSRADDRRWTADRIAVAILVALIVAGIALRVVAALAWWPVATNLGDSWPYATHAIWRPFDDPMHPAGYSLSLAAIGFFTRDVGVFTVLQNLMGIASATVLFAAVRRLFDSPWPGLLGAAVILLGADQVFLERSIMSETLFTLLLAATIYATARALETPERWYPWPLVAAGLGVAMGVTRSAGIVMLPLVALALVLAAPRPWLARWRPVAAFCGLALAGLLAYGTANDVSHDRFEIAPTPGWHLYSRAATMADCTHFDPPAGTEALCQTKPPQERLGMDWYLYYPGSPATRLYGNITIVEGDHDAELGVWARRAILADPRTFLKVLWPDLKAYFFPEDYEYRLGRGVSLDDQLDWGTEWKVGSTRTTARGMEEFFDPIEVERDHGLLDALHDYQRVFRFGATALTICSLLTLLGLCLGRRRERIALMLLGIGGLAMILLPTVSVNYSGRYTVPPAGPLAAAGAIAAIVAWRRLRSRSGLAA